MDRYPRGYDRNYSRDRDYGRDYDRRHVRDDRGFFDRAADEVRSWLGDDEAERRRRTDDRYEGRSDWRPDYRSERDYGRDYDRDERFENRYSRVGYQEPHWNEGAGRGYAYGRSSYERTGYDRDYDRDRGDGRGRRYDQDYERRSGFDRDFGDRGGPRGRLERSAGYGRAGRSSGWESSREYDYDHDNAGGYGGEYRTRGGYPEYGADRYDRDSQRDYGFPGWSYGMGRQ